MIHWPKNCFSIKKVEKSVEGKSQKKSRPKKAGPEAPANPYKKPKQNSKQQRSRRKRRSPHFWGCCFEFWIGFLKEFAGASGWASGQVFSWPGFLDIFLRHFFDIFFCQKICQNWQKHFWPNRFLDKKHMDKIMFENLGPEKPRSRKSQSFEKSLISSEWRFIKVYFLTI